MQGISKESKAILKGQNTNPVGHKGYMTLLSELSRIGQLILSKAQSPWTKWNLSWKAEDAEKENFSCTLTTNYAQEEHIKLSLHIHAGGRSYIEAGIDGDAMENEGIRSKIISFLKSPAGKRYFKLKDDKSAIIQADIHRKDIASRNFEDYMAHLINNMEPFLSIFLNTKTNNLRLV
ncbi:MAG: hypothetical protein ACI9FN_002909 [Saprospiraceae bacterium]